MKKEKIEKEAVSLAEPLQKITDYLWEKQMALAGTVRAVAKVKEENPETDPQYLLDKLAIVTAQNEIIKDITAIIESN